MATTDTVMRRWFEEVWNQRRESAIDEILAPDCLLHGLGPTPLRGAAEFRPFYKAFLGAFPDVRIEPVATVCDGDDGFIRFHVTGTHTGSSMGPATGQSISMDGAAHARLREGRVVEVWNLVDFLTMYQQIGWVTDPVAPA